MADQELAESEPQHSGDGITNEIGRLLKLLRRPEHENAALRRQLGTRALTA
jgi:hypothetical protein